MRSINNPIAVIILNYFGISDTIACIQSVKDELVNADIYLVDNSSDHTEQKKIKLQYQQDPQVITIFTTENLGFSKAVNLGLKKAVSNNHEYFMLLNNDAVLLKNSGAIINENLNKYPCSLVSSIIDWDNRYLSERFYNIYFSLVLNHPLLIKVSFVPFFTGCFLLFDKKLLDTVGYLNESFFMYGEDVEFCYRLKKMKLKAVLIDKCLVKHYGSLSARRYSFFYEYHINRGHVLLIKYLSSDPFEKFFMYLGRVLFLTSKGIWRTIKSRSLSPFMASILGWFPIKVRPVIKQ